MNKDIVLTVGKVWCDETNRNIVLNTYYMAATIIIPTYILFQLNVGVTYDDQDQFNESIIEDDVEDGKVCILSFLSVYLLELYILIEYYSFWVGYLIRKLLFACQSSGW